MTFAIAIFGAVRWGKGAAKSKYDAAQSKAQLDTFQKSHEAQDALEHSSDDDTTLWPRDRAGK